jgi:hypothetical protein
VLIPKAEYDRLDWVEIEGSSNIARIAFDGIEKTGDEPETGLMYVEFLSEDPIRPLYRYKGVPEPIFAGVRDAHSVGGAFAKAVKGRYAGERMEVYAASDDLDDDLRALMEATLEETRAVRRELANLTRLVKGLSRPRNHSSTTTPTGGTTA